jgi:2-polyprenyl-3-methyl-5-hydroxy-6-metoxy-1,4-benzoquinol methylase
MSLYSKYHTISDQRWLELLTGPKPAKNWLRQQAKRWLQPQPYDSALPKFPDEQLQKQFVGSSRAAALREGFQFYQIIKQNCIHFSYPILPTRKILDFGCGWGRVTRFFLKDLQSENLLGVDVDPEIIQVCKDTIQEGQYDVIPPYPPTNFAERSFDVIVAYSVFSHLAEEVHLLWVREFVRMLQPGGLIFITTQKRSFIEYCNNLTPEQIVTPWHKTLTQAFRPLDRALAQYDRGELVYSPTGGGGVRDASFYGEAAFSQGYVQQHWPPELELRVFDDTTLPQALIIAQKRLL